MISFCFSVVSLSFIIINATHRLIFLKHKPLSIDSSCFIDSPGVSATEKKKKCTKLRLVTARFPIFPSRHNLMKSESKIKLSNLKTGLIFASLWPRCHISLSMLHIDWYFWNRNHWACFINSPGVSASHCLIIKLRLVTERSPIFPIRISNYWKLIHFCCYHLAPLMLHIDWYFRNINHWA